MTVFHLTFELGSVQDIIIKPYIITQLI